jgi:hypothetical protein
MNEWDAWIPSFQSPFAALFFEDDCRWLKVHFFDEECLNLDDRTDAAPATKELN